MKDSGWEETEPPREARPSKRRDWVRNEDTDWGLYDRGARGRILEWIPAIAAHQIAKRTNPIQVGPLHCDSALRFLVSG